MYLSLSSSDVFGGQKLGLGRVPVLFLGFGSGPGIKKVGFLRASGTNVIKIQIPFFKVRFWVFRYPHFGLGIKKSGFGFLGT